MSKIVEIIEITLFHEEQNVKSSLKFNGVDCVIIEGESKYNGTFFETPNNIIEFTTNWNKYLFNMLTYKNFTKIRIKSINQNEITTVIGTLSPYSFSINGFIDDKIEYAVEVLNLTIKTKKRQNKTNATKLES